jgi:hypothetical protein
MNLQQLRHLPGGERLSFGRGVNTQIAASSADVECTATNRRSSDGKK